MGKRRKFKRLRSKMLRVAQLSPAEAAKISLEHTKRAYDIVKQCAVDAELQDEAAQKVATALASIDAQCPDTDDGDDDLSKYVNGTTVDWRW